MIHANRIILFFASLFAFLALVTLLYHTYSSNPNAVMIFMAFILISLFFELVYGRYVRGQFFFRRYKK